MRNRLLFAASLLLLFGCSHSVSIEDKAIGLVKNNYRDFEKVIFVKVDTITLGDNLSYRMQQNEHSIKFGEMQVKSHQDRIKEYEKYGASAKSMIDGATEDLRKAESLLNRERERLNALDSLRLATLDKAAIPAAYQVCVAYNYPTNFVWIQLAPDGTLLKMSKNREDLFFNPGEDMPGYFEIWERFYK